MATFLRFLLVLLAALPLFANRRVTVRMRDGAKIEMTKPAARGHIVEFTGAPLAAGGTRTAASYHDTFARFRRDLGEARTGGPATSAASRITHEFYRAFHGVAVALDESELAHVRALPYVKTIHEDEPVKAYADSNANDTTHLARIGAERFWSERNTRGAGTVVAVIDSGVDATHPALAGKVVGGWDFVGIDDDPSDAHGHGTHVAGIVLAVAPDAKLLAYRVLDEHGEGSSSDIVAAIEWAMDPDRDNDLSDHADVINLSLGGGGGANSPTSVAADRATEAGVVVCIAAGNTPGGQTIGSPAASRLAITVGATDGNDAITPWSSRGPSFPDLGLKPEISAPGNNIVSARMGGGTVSYSGTSMAAPHVAGAAALLLALHSGWSPSEVKAALVANADPVNEEVMARGGGRLNVSAAAGNAIVVDPPALTFGNGRAGGWTKTRVVRVTNRGSATQTFTATSTTANGATISAEPATFTLDPGASKDVTLTATIAAGGEPSAISLSHGGLVTFQSESVTARLPWVAIDAARVLVTYDAPDFFAFVSWACENGTHTDARRLSLTHHQALLPYRRCGMTLVGSRQMGSAAGESSILLETHPITDDLRIERLPAHSTHEVQLAGADHTGARIVPATGFGDTPYFAHYAFEGPADTLYRIGSLGTYAPGPLRVNTLDESITIIPSQVYFDFPRHRLYSINHEPLRGVASDRTLTTLASDLHHARISIAPRGGDFRLVPTAWMFSHDFGIGFTSGPGVPIGRGWRGDLYATREPDPRAWASASLNTARMELPDPAGDLRIDAIRFIGDRFALSREKTPSPAAYTVAPGETIRLGETPLRASSFVDTRDTAFAVFPSFFGPAGELVESASRDFTYVLRDATGTVLHEGTSETAYITADQGMRGGYSATFRSPHGTEIALAFDTSREDSNPPTLSSMRIVGADATIVTGVAPNEPATLTFAAFDAQDLRTTRASWRANGGAWQALAIELVTDDSGEAEELGHMPTGRHYRTALPTHILGDIDLRFELDDASGNTSTVTIEEALSVGGRRRAVRR